MQLNHLDIPVPQPAVTKAFFVEHFGFQSIFERADGLIVLLDETGFALTLSPLPIEETLKYPTGFHIGFNLQEKSQLLRLYESFFSLPFAEIIRPIGEVGGALSFQCNAPGPILVEFNWRPGT